MAAKLRATWAMLFWPTWPAAVDRVLLLDERNLGSQIDRTTFQRETYPKNILWHPYFIRYKLSKKSCLLFKLIENFF